MQLFETPIKTVIFNQIKLKKWQRYQVRILFEPQCTCEGNWVQIKNHFWSKPNPKESQNYFTQYHPMHRKQISRPIDQARYKSVVLDV